MAKIRRIGGNSITPRVIVIKLVVSHSELFSAQGLHRIDRSGSPGRKIAGEQR